MSKFEWNFTPFEGIGDVKFGDTRQAVREKMRELFKQEPEETRGEVNFTKGGLRAVTADYYPEQDLTVAYTDEGEACQFMFFTNSCTAYRDLDLSEFLDRVNFKINFLEKNIVTLPVKELVKLTKDFKLKVTQKSSEDLDLGEIGLSFYYDGTSGCPYHQSILIVDVKNALIFGH